MKKINYWNVSSTGLPVWFLAWSSCLMRKNYNSLVYGHSRSLEERQNRADLLEVFKMYKGWSTTKFRNLFSLMDNSRTRGHSAKIAKNQCHLDLRRHFFSQWVIDRWNPLDQMLNRRPSMRSSPVSAEHDKTRPASLGTYSPPSSLASSAPVTGPRCSYTWYVPGMYWLGESPIEPFINTSHTISEGLSN